MVIGIVILREGWGWERKGKKGKGAEDLNGGGNLMYQVPIERSTEK